MDKCYFKECIIMLLFNYYNRIQTWVMVVDFYLFFSFELYSLGVSSL